MNLIELRRALLLSTQRALLGMVTPAMKAVKVGWSEGTLSGTVYFSNEPTNVEIEWVSEIETEVLADFPEEIEVQFTAEIYSREKLRGLAANEAVVFHVAQG